VTDVSTQSAAAPPRLVATIGPFGFLGWAILFGIGELLVVPMPWTTTGYFGYLCRHLALPDGRRLTFAGKPGDIWYILIAIPILLYAMQVMNFMDMQAMIQSGAVPTVMPHWYIVLIVEVAMFYLGFLVLRWAIERTTSEDGSMKLRFAGGFLANFGWLILFGLSAITIVGWAWVLKFYIRWMCRKVEGTVRFDFIGTGWGILWRMVIVWLTSILIIPIPWTIAWLTNWFFSNVTATSDARP
jgi:hypothetical protein